MLSCIKNEQVREELLKNLEDFKKLVKKRGSFGACFLPDAFGRIVTADYTAQGAFCSQTIRRSWAAIDNVTSTGKGPSTKNIRFFGPFF